MNTLNKCYLLVTISYGIVRCAVVIDNKEPHYSKVEKSKDGCPQFECGLVIQKDFITGFTNLGDIASHLSAF